MKKQITALIVLVIVIVGLNFAVPFLSKTAVAPVATTTNEVSIGDWKTYKNDKYGFEFKYPGDWKINNSLPEVVKVVLDQRIISIDIINDYRQTNGGNCTSFVSSSITIDKKQVTVEEKKGCPEYNLRYDTYAAVIPLTTNPKTDLTFSTSAFSNTGESFTIERRILSTFKFTK